MIIDDLKNNTAIALQKANDEGLRMLGAGIAKGFFLKNIVMFSEGFDLNPAAILTGQFQDEKHYILYAQFIKTLVVNITALYGLTEKEVMAVMDESAAELLEGFKRPTQAM